MSSLEGGKAVRGAVAKAILPAKRLAKAQAPVARPPYVYDGRTVDPYPRKTYKGRRVTPGFASRSVVHSTRLSRDKATATARLGVRREAFYATQFVELGTSRIPKRPWLEPAFRASQAPMNNAFRRELKRRIDLAAAKARK